MLSTFKIVDIDVLDTYHNDITDKYKPWVKYNYFTNNIRFSVEKWLEYEKLIGDGHLEHLKNLCKIYLTPKFSIEKTREVFIDLSDIESVERLVTKNNIESISNMKGQDLLEILQPLRKKSSAEKAKDIRRIIQKDPCFYFVVKYNGFIGPEQSIDLDPTSGHKAKYVKDLSHYMARTMDRFFETVADVFSKYGSRRELLNDLPNMKSKILDAIDCSTSVQYTTGFAEYIGCYLCDDNNKAEPQKKQDVTSTVYSNLMSHFFRDILCALSMHSDEYRIKKSEHDSEIIKKETYNDSMVLDAIRKTHQEDKKHFLKEVFKKCFVDFNNSDLFLKGQSGNVDDKLIIAEKILKKHKVSECNVTDNFKKFKENPDMFVIKRKDVRDELDIFKELYNVELPFYNKECPECRRDVCRDSAHGFVLNKKNIKNVCLRNLCIENLCKAKQETNGGIEEFIKSLVDDKQERVIILPFEGFEFDMHVLEKPTRLSQTGDFVELITDDKKRKHVINKKTGEWSVYYHIRANIPEKRAGVLHEYNGLKNCPHIILLLEYVDRKSLQNNQP